VLTSSYAGACWRRPTSPDMQGMYSSGQHILQIHTAVREVKCYSATTLKQPAAT